MPKSKKGFTLIELMIAVTIMAILIAIAIPSYNRYLTKSRRADAKTSLMTIAQLQETYFADNNFYAEDLDKLAVRREGFPVIDGGYSSKDGYYKIDFERTSTSYFLARATPIGIQKTDEESLGKYCYTFLLDSRGTKTVSGTSSNSNNAQDCWN